MQTITLFMLCTPVAQAVMQQLRSKQDVRLVYVPVYDRLSSLPDGKGVALIEVAETGRPVVSFCLSLCDRIRRANPDCRLVLMCPELHEQSVAGALEAKRQGRIDDFVFCDSSVDYVTAKLLSLLLPSL